MNIDEMLNELSQYGEPLVYYLRSTRVWYCTIELQAIVSTAKVKITARDAAPTKAIETCLKDLKDAIAKTTPRTDIGTMVQALR